MYAYSVRNHSTEQEEETSLIRYCKGRGYTCEKVRRILPIEVQTVKPACIVLYLKCWGKKCNCLQGQTKGNTEKCFSGRQSKYKNSNNDKGRALRWA